MPQQLIEFRSELLKYFADAAEGFTLGLRLLQEVHQLKTVQFSMENQLIVPLVQ